MYPAHYTECSPEDWQAVGYEPGHGPVPERIIVDLPGRGPVSALAGWGRHYGWSVVSARDFDGDDVELSAQDEHKIRAALMQRDDDARGF